MAEKLDFFDFVAERLEVEHKKAVGLPRPWTQDEVIRDTRFTNIDRNHDRGTIKLLQKVRGLPHPDIVLYVVLFRCAYSSLSLLEALTLDPVQDLNMLAAVGVKVPARKPYQVFLKKSQSMMKFLVTTGVSVSAFTSSLISTASNASIIVLADQVAEHFRSCHGRKLHFLATEIVKDLSVLIPGAIDPDSECRMNVGSSKGLRLIGWGNAEKKVEYLREKTGLNYSVLEHALCEYSKYVERWKHFDKEKCFRTSWIYHPSTVPLVAFKDVIDQAA